MSAGKSKIIYTLTDEAPLLATCALLPIIRTFTGPAGVDIDEADISVSSFKFFIYKNITFTAMNDIFCEF